MTAKQMREFRTSFGLTQDALANIVGVSSGRTVRRWELGERKIPETTARLLISITDRIKGRGKG